MDSSPALDAARLAFIDGLPDEMLDFDLADPGDLNALFGMAREEGVDPATFPTTFPDELAAEKELRRNGKKAPPKVDAVKKKPPRSEEPEVALPQGTRPAFRVRWTPATGLKKPKSKTFSTHAAAQREIAKRLKPSNVPDTPANRRKGIKPGVYPPAEAVFLDVGYTVWEDSTEVTDADEVVAPLRRRRKARAAVEKMRRTT